MTDVVFCIIPKIEPQAPTSGVAVLKQVCMNAGYTSTVVDFNIDLYNYLKQQNLHEKYWHDDDSLFLNHGELEHNPDWVDFVQVHGEIIDLWIERLRELEPRYIGLSLLTMYSKSCAITLAQRIRQHLPDSKIIWGGPPVDRYFSDCLIDADLADHYVIGDGEIAILNILREGTVKQSSQNLNISDLPFPNYDDINWEQYEQGEDSADKKVVYVTASRGCIKRCTFCNVRDIWPRYLSRPGAQVAEEIKFLSDAYGRLSIKFTDSLINGSMRDYRELVQQLIEYRHSDQLPEELGWTSQWIVRSQQRTQEEDFANAHLANCRDLEIGIEHFSEKVRWHMGKRFTDEDMWFTFEMMTKHRIPSSILMIVGYPTETEQDHQTQLRTLEEIFRRGYVYNKQKGHQVMHFTATPMLLDGEIYEMVKDDLEYYNNERDWKLGDNDTQTRMRRYSEFQEKLQQLQGTDWSWSANKELRVYANAQV